MTNSILLDGTKAHCRAKIKLEGSKSISNRVLLIRALSKKDFIITNLSKSDDTVTLKNLLESDLTLLDAHHAGTTFRFLTAYLALQEGVQELTGSERMKQRPIKALVDALNDLGANIEYIGQEGFPPLRIHPPAAAWGKKVSVPAGISSQYLSALLMIAPILPEGLSIELEGDPVSRPYIVMTLRIMEEFGITFSWTDDVISIPPQNYQAKDFDVEADWSAASYYYSIAAISDDAEIEISGLGKNSLQGDSAIAELSKNFGVFTTPTKEGILITKKGTKELDFLEYDFIERPDIAQTIFVACTALGIKGLFSGLKTLYIKETDRLKACATELSKVGASLHKVPARFKRKSAEEFYMLEGNATFQGEVAFDTYNDHRMAMAFAPLALKKAIVIHDFEVVSKSYPDFWKDLEKLGFLIKTL